jgi:myosin heavy subunit
MTAPCLRPPRFTAFTHPVAHSASQFASNIETVWKVMAAILHLGNAKFTGQGDDDAKFVPGCSIEHAAKLLGCVSDQLTKALCTLNIKAGLDWIAKPNTTR